MKIRKKENLTLVLNIFSLSLNEIQPQVVNHFLNPHLLKGTFAAWKCEKGNF